MKRLFKLYISTLLTLSLSVATVMCCCSAAAAMAHWHKAAVKCGHCQNQNSQGHSSKPVAACQQQLTSAEFSQSQVVSIQNATTLLYAMPVALHQHQAHFSPMVSSAYPPGGPPLGISFTPLYLRTFNLRI